MRWCNLMTRGAWNFFWITVVLLFYCPSGRLPLGPSTGLGSGKSVSVFRHTLLTPHYTSFHYNHIYNGYCVLMLRGFSVIFSSNSRSIIDYLRGSLKTLALLVNQPPSFSFNSLFYYGASVIDEAILLPFRHVPWLMHIESNMYV